MAQKQEVRTSTKAMRFVGGKLLWGGLFWWASVVVAIADTDNPWRLQSSQDAQSSTTRQQGAPRVSRPVWAAPPAQGRNNAPAAEQRRGSESKRIQNGGVNIDGQGAHSLSKDAASSRSAETTAPDRELGQQLGRKLGRQLKSDDGRNPSRGRPGGFGQKQYGAAYQNGAFGYSGAQRGPMRPLPSAGAKGSKGATEGRPQGSAVFGRFPPMPGKEGGRREQADKAVRFDGRIYGAFPPLEKQPTLKDRRQGRFAPKTGLNARGYRASEFNNVPPPPAPPPPPGSLYPRWEYGAPPPGGAYGDGLPGALFNPLAPGLGGPGGLW